MTAQGRGRMNKFCAVKQIECEHVIQCGYINFGHLRQCPWPARQMPINDIAAKMCKKPRIINGLYIVDETPVAPTLDTVSAYQAGRADMKREIGEKVKLFLHTHGYSRHDLITAIEGVK